MEVVAFRELCYRWTCECGCNNRLLECAPGDVRRCVSCLTPATIYEVVFDNGTGIVAAKPQKS